MKINRRGAVSIIAVLIAVALVSLAVAGVANLGDITGSGGYMERVVIKWAKCEAIAALKTSSETTIAKDGMWLDTNRPSVSSSYTVHLKEPTTWYVGSATRVEYYVCNSRSFNADNCRVWSKKQLVTGQIDIQVSGKEYVWAQFQAYVPFQYLALSNAKYDISYVPYGLREYNPLGTGGIINGADCSVPLSDDTWQDRFVSTDSSKIKSQITQTNTLERTLEPEEVRYSVAGYVTSAAPSFALTYNGLSAWCNPEGTTASIYKINTITTGSTTYKVASLDYSDKIATVTCCPGDKQPSRSCNSNFQWVSTVEAQCSTFKPCDGGDWTPYGEKTIGKYSCVSGQCVIQTKAVECSGDAQCGNTNALCDRDSWTCEQANVNVDGKELIVAPETSAECKAAGGTWVSEKTESKTLLNYVGIGQPSIVTKDYCDLKGFNWLALGVLSLFLAGAYAFRGQIYGFYKSTIGRYIGG